ncbi:hypothetical protein ACFL3P_04745 [Pseudomonadota bacterium]
MFNHRSIALIFLFVSFNLLTTSASAATGTVVSTIDAAGYTYVEADTGNEKIWLAGPKTAIVQGGAINVDTSNPMRNFHSKTLNRDFPVLYFVDGFSGGAVQNQANTDSASATDLPIGNAMPAKTMTLGQPVERAKDGQTIAEIIAGKKEFSGNRIKVRGKITKFTANIMNKNWIHMIDGSSDSDLIVITKDDAKVGQMVMVEGSVVLDKDFGYGYFYELLIDNARVIVE